MFNALKVRKSKQNDQRLQLFKLKYAFQLPNHQSRDGKGKVVWTDVVEDMEVLSFA